MSKKKLLSLGIIAVCAVIVLTVFSIVFQRFTGVDLPWWAYLIGLVIYALIVYLIYIITKITSQQFDAMLAREHFNVDKRYQWDKQYLCIDFQSKRIADTYIATKPIVHFAEIAGFRYETYKVGAEEELPEDKCFVSLVLTVKKEGFDFEYLYIPMFEVAVDVEDVGDSINEISPELVEKYPELKDVYELQSDVQKILEINLSEGITSNVRKD